jgi:hypothetical protein
MDDNISTDLSKNYDDFIKSAQEDINKERFNPAVSSYFKAIAIFCDLNIYKKVGLLPKNHAERFLYLKMHFKDAYEILSPLFKEYTDSYNKRISKEKALNLKENVEKIKTIFKDKE